MEFETDRQKFFPELYTNGISKFSPDSEDLVPDFYFPDADKIKRYKRVIRPKVLKLKKQKNQEDLIYLKNRFLSLLFYKIEHKMIGFPIKIDTTFCEGSSIEIFKSFIKDTGYNITCCETKEYETKKFTIFYVDLR